MANITIIVGPPCAGKSTYASNTSQAGDVIIDYDKIVKAISAPSTTDFMGSVRNIALSARQSAINRIMNGIEDNAFIIHTNPLKDVVDDYKKINAQFVLIDPGIDVCLRRAEQRKEGTKEAINEWYRNPPPIIAELNLTPVKHIKGLNMKHKLLDIQNIEFKFDENKTGSFSGYASVFNGVDSYGDTIEKGAYTKTLKSRSRPVQLRWNHFGDVIGKWTKIEEDDKGLYVEGELTPGHSKAQDVYASLKHGAISGLSIGYRPVEYEENDKGGLNLKEIDLVEISIVETPADNSAHIADIKNLDEAKSLKEIEAYLRDAHNLSRSEAVAVVSRLKTVMLGEQAEKEKTTNTLAFILDAKNQLARRI